MKRGAKSKGRGQYFLVNDDLLLSRLMKRLFSSFPVFMIGVESSMCDLSDLNRGTNWLSYSHLIGHTQQDFLHYDVVVLTVIPKRTLHFGNHL